MSAAPQITRAMATERKRKHADGTEALNNACLWRRCASALFDTV
jgi:hypothetical protein